MVWEGKLRQKEVKSYRTEDLGAFGSQGIRKVSFVFLCRTNEIGKGPGEEKEKGI